MSREVHELLSDIATALQDWSEMHTNGNCLGAVPSYIPELRERVEIVLKAKVELTSLAVRD